MILKKWSQAFLMLMALLNCSLLQANEGLWLPSQLPKDILANMKKTGSKLTAAQIYTVNKACLKDVVLSLSQDDATFSPFASASFVSKDGLVLTNFHPMMKYLEQLSSVKNDFVRYGYWSTKAEEETHLNNLQVNQLMEIRDVTKEISQRLDTVAPQKLETEINARSASLIAQRTSNMDCSAKIYAVSGKSQYLMVVYRVFSDVRMVAAPPIAVGKFGGDADNWMWTRQAGDFAFLRVYANKDNEPARYDKSNQPYHPASVLKISLRGVKESDFTMALGFPSLTRYYVPSFALDKMIFKDMKAKSEMTAIKRDVFKTNLKRNDTLRIRYTPRVSSLENVYLKNCSEMEGIRSTELVKAKQEEERAFQTWAESTPERKQEYGSLLNEMEQVYDSLTVYNLADLYFNETAINGADVIPFAGKFEKLMAISRRRKVDPEALAEESSRLYGLIDQFFNQYDRPTDQSTFTQLLNNYVANVPERFYSEALRRAVQVHGKDLSQFLESAYERSLLNNRDSLVAFLNAVPTQGIVRMHQDPLYQLSLGFYYIQTSKIMRERGKWQQRNGDLYTQYLKGLFEFRGSKSNFPDANKTPRLSYGKVLASPSENGGMNRFYSTLDEAFVKNANQPENPDFQITPKLKKLFQSRDFGRYAVNDTIRTSFMTDMHTTSGNSGSPVLNAKGELVGLNFDRLGKGSYSDYRYNPLESRSLAVDIRYILFLIEKYSPSGRLIKELEIKK